MQFEKDTEEDPFGLNKFLTEAKKAKRPVTDRYAKTFLNTKVHCAGMFPTGSQVLGGLKGRSTKSVKMFSS